LPLPLPVHARGGAVALGTLNGTITAVRIPSVRLRHLGAAVPLLLAIVLSACGSTSTPTEGNAPAAAPAGAPGTPAPDSTVSQVASAKGASVDVYASPDAPTPMRSDPNPWIYDNQPDAKVPLVYLVKSTVDNEWLEVYLASRPNGSTGFIKRDQVDVKSDSYRIEVHLGAFNIKAYNGHVKILDAPIAIGADDGPTPGGMYYVNVLLASSDASYGPYAFGLSGHSDVYQTFNGGDGQLGLHGTDQPDKIGTKVSHGCIRLKNDDITTLAKQIPLGTPIQILA
jgi:lipoprotein-anchoring transpeptidase ErfK/SrfK